MRYSRELDSFPKLAQTPPNSSQILHERFEGQVFKTTFLFCLQFKVDFQAPVSTFLISFLKINIVFIFLLSLTVSLANDIGSKGQHF